jgi:hypothetical protein
MCAVLRVPWPRLATHDAIQATLEHGKENPPEVYRLKGDWLTINQRGY